MKNCFVCIILFLVNSVVGYTQSFLEVGNQWIFETSDFRNNIQDTCQYLLNDAHWIYNRWSITCQDELHEVKIIGDTLIDENLCSIIGAYNDGVFVDSSELILLNSDDHVQFYEDSTFKTLYDFRAMTIDAELEFYLPENYKFYDISSFGAAWLPGKNPYYSKVTAIETISTTNGEEIELIRTASIMEDSDDRFDLGEIFFGVGSKIGFLGTGPASLPSGCESYLRCYQDDRKEYSLIDGDCLSVGTQDIERRQTTFFPNPATTTITIESELDFTDYQIIDSNGAVHSSSSFQPTLNVAHLPSGIYFIRLTDKSQQSLILKAIKE